MTMDPDDGAPRRLKLKPIVAEVAGRRLGRVVGQKFAAPIAEFLRDRFSEDTLRTLTGGVDNPLLAFGIDAAWVLIAEEMNPGNLVNRDGEEHKVTDEAWEGFVIELQRTLKEKANMARQKPPAGGAVPPAAPPPKPNPLVEAVMKRAEGLILDEAKMKAAADEMNVRAEATRRDARNLEKIKTRSFWDECVLVWRDLIAWIKTW